MEEDAEAKRSCKTFYKKEVGNGRHISFWYDRSSEKGINREATVEETVLSTRKKRRHRTEILNAIETEISVLKDKLRSNVEDVSLWKRKSGFKQKFLTQETWMLLRETNA